MAWAFSVLKASHFADSHPVLTNKVSRCCNCPKAIPRKECGIALIRVRPCDRRVTISAKLSLLIRSPTMS
eukprot:s416_g31.t1